MSGKQMSDIPSELLKQPDTTVPTDPVMRPIVSSTLRVGLILTRARDRSRWEVVALYRDHEGMRAEMIRRGGGYTGQRRRTRVYVARLAAWLGGVEPFALVLLDASPPCKSYRSGHCWATTEGGGEQCTVCGVVAELRGTDQETFAVQP